MDEDQKSIIRRLEILEPDIKWDYIHAHLHIFDDTEVEIHYRPCSLYNLRRNKYLQMWFLEHLETRQVEIGDRSISVPSWNFNI